MNTLSQLLAAVAVTSLVFSATANANPLDRAYKNSRSIDLDDYRTRGTRIELPKRGDFFVYGEGRSTYSGGRPSSGDTHNPFRQPSNQIGVGVGLRF